MMCHIAICLHFEKSKMAAEIGEFLISMPFDSLPPILSLTPRWLFQPKPEGPKPAWIYRDTGEILVSQCKVT